MLLQPHTGRRPIRAHEGTVIAPASNQRWASDGLEISCWNGEVVRVAFAIDTHDREIIAWIATSGGGISGEMIRDMMLDCVERRFDGGHSIDITEASAPGHLDREMSKARSRGRKTPHTDSHCTPSVNRPGFVGGFNS